MCGENVYLIKLRCKRVCSTVVEAMQKNVEYSGKDDAKSPQYSGRVGDSHADGCRFKSMEGYPDIQPSTSRPCLDPQPSSNCDYNFNL